MPTNFLLAGYISMMIPSNMLLSIFKPRIYLPTVVIIWGIVSTFPLLHSRTLHIFNK